MQIGQRGNCFLCGLENVWLSTLVHEYHLKQYCSQDVDDITHIYFWRGSAYFVESWGGGALAPLAPPSAATVKYILCSSSDMLDAKYVHTNF